MRSAKGYLAAALEPEFARQAYRAAVDSQMRAYAFPEASATLEKLEVGGPLERDEAWRSGTEAILGKLLSGLQTTDIRFDEPVSPSWAVRDPLALRRDPRDGVLDISGWRTRGVIAVLPLVRTSGYASLEMELAPMRSEWGSGLRFILRPMGDHSAELRFVVNVHCWGGGGILNRLIDLSAPVGDGVTADLTGTVSHSHTMEPLVASIRVAPALGEAICSVSNPAGETLISARGKLSDELPSGAWELVIESGGDEAIDLPVLTEVRLKSITLAGFQIGGSPSLSGVPGAFSYIEGDSDTAAEKLEDGVTRALALGELGLMEESADLLAKIEWPSLGIALRSRPELSEGLIRRALGARYFEFWAETQLGVASLSGDVREAESAIRDQLSGIEELAPDDPVVVSLLLGRGRARWAAGQTGAARADLQRALVGAEALADDESLSQIHRLLAFIDVTTGAEAAAIEHAELSVRFAQVSELAVDRLLLNEIVAARRGEAGWAEVLRFSSPLRGTD